MLLSAIGQETSVTSSTKQMKKKVALLVFSLDSVFVFLQANSRFYWDTCGSPVIKCLCFFCLFFSSTTKWENGAIVPVVIGPSTPWHLTVIQWGIHMLITRVILMMVDVVMHRQGRVTWRITRFLLIKLFCQSFCISTYLDCDLLEHYGANAQNTYRRIYKSY